MFPCINFHCIKFSLHQNFIASESHVLKYCISDRKVFCQECHEEVRKLSQTAAAEVKEKGKDNNLVELIKKSDYFRPVQKDLDKLLEPSSFVGRAPQQVFLTNSYYFVAAFMTFEP